MIKTLNTIKTETINAHKCPNFIKPVKTKLSREYDQHHGPENLKMMCLQTLALNWEDNPILEELVQPEDRCQILDLLPLTLPLKLTVNKIPDNFYWKKCYNNRWSNNSLFNVNDYDMFYLSNEDNCTENSNICNENVKLQNKSWKVVFLEKHLQEIVENMKPENYDPEEIKILIDICAPYVKTLIINELKLSEDKSDRISLNAIITGLTNLEELSICFIEKKTEFDNFSWNIIQTPFRDILHLSKGLEKCKLKIIRIINSDIDGEKCKILIRAMKKYEFLQVIDFSHCNIGDEGTFAVCKLALDLKIKEINLENNNIGTSGGQAIHYYISHEDCNLNILNLKLNNLNQTGNEIIYSISNCKTLKILDLSACNIKIDSSLITLLKINQFVEHISLNNNKITQELALSILNNLSNSSSLKKLDLRMCNITTDLHWKICKKIAEKKAVKYVYTNEEVPKLQYTEEFINKFNLFLE